MKPPTNYHLPPTTLTKNLFLYLFLIMATACQTHTPPLNIGHRGAMGHVLENTLPSIDKALELGVDMIEIDVFVIASGELVVFHDDELDRLALNAQGPIENHTRETLQQVVLKDQHRIPLLEEVINRIDKKVPLNIELKGAHTARPTHALLQSFFDRGWNHEHFIISSFRWDELETYHSLDPKMPLAVLTEDDPLQALPTAKNLKAVAINPWWKTLNTQNVKTLQKEGFKVFTYTVNEPQDIKTVTQWGVDGIFCNFPERVK